MTVKIFETVEELNSYLAKSKAKEIDIKFTSQVVGHTVNSLDGSKSYEVVDRFMVVEK